ncbi:MAG: YidC/Oxa1 family insertase periplasmic-domain containing protein [Planctomycetota bacterium]|jgi:YidC/Oxa1 family membrane protein insertase
MKKVLTLTIIGFCIFCGILIAESGFFGAPLRQCGPCILLESTAEKDAAEPTEPNDVGEEKQTPKITADEKRRFGAAGGPQLEVVLGSAETGSEYKYELELTSRGAAIRSATFSGFNDRDPDDPQQLRILSPMIEGDSEVLSMALGYFRLFLDAKSDLFRPLSLEDMSWKTSPIEKGEDGSQKVAFEAKITDPDGKPVVKVVRTFKIMPGSYLLNGEISVVNLSENPQKIKFNLNGPGGLGREAFQSDMRRIVGGYQGDDEEVTSQRLKKETLLKPDKPEEHQLGVDKLLWAATVNKYFAAIVVPEKVADGPWIRQIAGRLYNPDGDKKADTGDETMGFEMQTIPAKLGPADHNDCSIDYKFQLYIGPKDKSFFDKDPMYKRLGFYQTIEFRGCCCPASIIKPLAFGILAIMKTMHGVWPHNYGIVIIILVLCVRFILHPITKKSQVSMNKMQKLAPMAEEIKKKYANNKAEMNKQMMALYREQGASPIMGFLPMMIQMPIWIALWSAVYASIDLRGAAFLPFWITDLSLPDRLFEFPGFSLPFLGSYFNLLPIMMGIAFYLQQKLMPKQAAAATNPQVAQQQKMMMIMFPLLFPVMLYKAPSGVNLYIMSSTFAGVIEQYVIRKHIREKEEAESQGLVATTKKTGGKVKKKKPKPFYRT